MFEALVLFGSGSLIMFVGMMAGYTLGKDANSISIIQKEEEE